MLPQSIKSLIPANGVLEVKFDSGKIIKFQDIWLRDNCRCNDCYHADTFQRAKHILDLPNVNIVHVTYDKTDVTVKCKDIIRSDNHESMYAADFLSKFDYKSWKNSRRLKPILWRGEKVRNKITRINVNEFLNTIDGAKSVFQSLLDYGLALIEGVDATLDSTEVVCKALGGIQHTLFGGMWQFTTSAVHADTAYTNLPLASHNDNTYFTEAAGLQVLHCLEHSNGTGGETTLVDGFYGASCLMDEHPEDYEFLTTFDIEAEYIEENHHHSYSAPVIIVDKKTQDLKQIRFNVYDRAPMPFDRPEDCKLYYRSIRNLSRYYEDKSNQWQFKLKPGVVLVMDNFRVLHGRTGFSGTRILCGCYVSRSDWLDKARTLRLIQ